MNPISLELTKLRALAALLVLVSLLALAGAVGWTLNGWHLDGPHAREVAALDKQLTALQGAVDVQNVKIEAAGAATAAADDRRKQAEVAAVRAIDRINTRSAAVATSTATDCAGVLHGAWGAWK